VLGRTGSAVADLGIAATCRNALLSLCTRGRHVHIGLTTQKETANQESLRRHRSDDQFPNVGVSVIDRF
jgi:hypothetical protein